ncbi:MAG: FRG domain-containing protein [Sedimentisphaerales bacterium]|nr:FRG domain-containing protein [Sedimentisphaerales bacterium]
MRKGSKGKQNKELYKTKNINEWNKLYNFYLKHFTDDNREWVFRGEILDSDDNDNSHIPEKAFKSRLHEDFEYFKICTNKRPNIEKKLIREFRRNAPIHAHNQRQENWLDCLALMQHYEGSTRMLDWTYSFFVALYFALNRFKINKDNRDDSQKGKSCVIWALDNEWLGDINKKYEDEFIKKEEDSDNKNSLQKLKEDGRGWFENYIIHDFIEKEDKNQVSKENAIIYAVNPYYLHQRLSIQRGVLLFPSKISISWGKNLELMLKNKGGQKNHLWKIEILFDNIEIQKQFLQRLYDMNISQASLFPDLDGLAKSLRTRLVTPPFTLNSFLDK